MFDDAKYIVFEDNGLEDIVIFSILQTHNVMAHRLRFRAISAGFIRISDDGEPVCYGKSESLRLDSRALEDTSIAKRALNRR